MVSVSGLVDLYGGSLVVYNTVRYHAVQGSITLRVDSADVGIAGNTYWVRVGLHLNGTQFSNSLEWSYSQFGQTRAFTVAGSTLISPRNFAMQARSCAVYASYANGGGSRPWYGTLNY